MQGLNPNVYGQIPQPASISLTDEQLRQLAIYIVIAYQQLIQPPQEAPDGRQSQAATR